MWILCCCIVRILSVLFMIGFSWYLVNLTADGAVIPTAVDTFDFFSPSRHSPVQAFKLYFGQYSIYLVPSIWTLNPGKSFCSAPFARITQVCKLTSPLMEQAILKCGSMKQFIFYHMNLNLSVNYVHTNVCHLHMPIDFVSCLRYHFIVINVIMNIWNKLFVSCTDWFFVITGYQLVHVFHGIGSKQSRGQQETAVARCVQNSSWSQQRHSVVNCWQRSDSGNLSHLHASSRLKVRPDSLGIAEFWLKSLLKWGWHQSFPNGPKR